MAGYFLFSGGKSSIGSMVSKFAGAFVGIFLPVSTLCLTALEFIIIDFIVGVWASYARAKKAGKVEQWGFESKKAWKTIWKLIFVIAGIVMCDHLDHQVLTFVELNLPKIFCGFVCGVELWSFLENAACISNSPVFMWLRKFMGDKVSEFVITPDNVDKNTTNSGN